MDKYFEYKETDWIGIIIFKISVDQANIDKVFHHIENISKTNKLILDLKGVDFVNSTFIWYM